MSDSRVESSSPAMLYFLGALIVGLAIVWWPGCRQYPPVSSRESLDLIKLLYAACNTRDPARLARVEKTLEELTAEGKLAAIEQAAFSRIVGLARAGEWKKAEQAAFKFAQDQVGKGHPSERRPETAERVAVGRR